MKIRTDFVRFGMIEVERKGAWDGEDKGMGSRT